MIRITFDRDMDQLTGFIGGDVSPMMSLLVVNLATERQSVSDGAWETARRIRVNLADIGNGIQDPPRTFYNGSSDLRDAGGTPVQAWSHLPFTTA